jgi:wobble nucleotide-excising tRNase
MTLTKFVSIKNVGRFQNYNAAGDVTLKRVNLIFAENGRGKSTLCAVLRSLQSNDPAYVLGRTTLGSTSVPDIALLTETGLVNFKAGAWTQPLPHLAVFDSTFIAENVFSGDAVDLEHKRNLYRVIIGKQGVSLAQEVNDFDAAIRASTSAIKNKRAVVEGRVPAGVGLDVFIVLASDAEVDSKIATKEKELESVQQAAQLKTRASLSEVAIPPSLEGFESVLGLTVADLSAAAEHRVAEHVAAHKMKEAGEKWIQEGLEYIQADACPFCEQSLKGLELIAAYRAFFDEAYGELKESISDHRDTYSVLLGDRAIADIEKILDGNVAATEFWGRYCTVVAPQLSAPQGVGRVLREWRDAAMSLCDRKAAAPLEVVPPDQRYLTAFAVVQALLASAIEYNAAVRVANATITAKKTSLESASVDQIQRELQKLKATKARHTPDCVKACDEHAAEVKKKETLEGKKTEARDKLDAHTKTVIKTYEKTINKILGDFRAGFRITGTKHGYPGGVPSSDFQILINETPVSLGDGKTPLSTPSFRNTLSSGDKSTLALAFFLAELEHDPNKAGRIVIFDDPFNSQDAFRKDHTVQKIRKCGVECLQVIVLSHDQGFLRRLYDRLREQSIQHKCLHLTRVGQSNTLMTEWDIEEATQAQQRADINALSSYYNSAIGKPRDVVNKIRPVLETYSRNLFPTQFEDDDTLGVICGKIKNAGSAHGLAPVLDDLIEANDYTKRYHHGENPNAAAEPINDTELQGFVAKTLSVVGCC